ncbi:hypothetical protein CK203_047668 [Vitis vinifera]|uniref:Uncharacterized protein n=1 Tax=Vitis vinifera TaxID=29760 RepID=A0A438H5R6_VITVI|nr:hypothetical protein CK203_047668 [Vitis vinifera]
MFIWHPSDLDVNIFLDTWRREKANHIQCHSTAEYGFVPPKFRWWHFESLEQFPEEALPKPPYAIYGPLVAICAKKKGTTKMDSLEFYMELSGACKDWVASLRHFSIWMGRLGIIPKGMLDALHPYLSPNLREDQHHIAHIPRIVVTTKFCNEASSLEQGYEEEQRRLTTETFRREKAKHIQSDSTAEWLCPPKLRLPLWIFGAVPEGRFAIACLKLHSKRSMWSELLVPSM